MRKGGRVQGHLRKSEDRAARVEKRSWFYAVASWACNDGRCQVRVRAGIQRTVVARDMTVVELRDQLGSKRQSICLIAMMMHIADY